MEDICKAYREALTKLEKLNVEWVQMDEPALVTDLTKEDIVLFEALYKTLLSVKGTVKVLLQTYFGDVRDCYENLINLIRILEARDDIYQARPYSNQGMTLD